MNCSSCKTPMQSLGHVAVRVGGTSGGWHLLLGDWAEAGEALFPLFPLDVYRCSSCKRVEFFDLENKLSTGGESQ
jgi:hypothetical protein